MTELIEREAAVGHTCPKHGDYTCGITGCRVMRDFPCPACLHTVPATTVRESLHPEDSCQKCGRVNVVWFAPSPLWNEVVREKGEPEILCPVCFIRLAEAVGIKGVWKVAPSTSGEFEQHAVAQWNNQSVARRATPPPTEAPARSGNDEKCEHGIYWTRECLNCTEEYVAVDSVVDEVQRRMDAVVDAAVAWAADEDNEEFDRCEILSAAVDSLLQLRSKGEFAPAVTGALATAEAAVASFAATDEPEPVAALRELFNMVNYALDSRDALLISKTSETMLRAEAILAAPTEAPANCVKCGCSGGVDANGWCMSGRPYIANLPDSNQRSICACRCEFVPAITGAASEEKE